MPLRVRAFKPRSNAQAVRRSVVEQRKRRAPVVIPKRFTRSLCIFRIVVRRAAAVHSQRELNFGTRGASEEGYKNWLAIRQLAVEDVAKRMNLPLGHEVEVWLTGGIRLRGRLRLQEGLLF